MINHRRLAVDPTRIGIPVRLAFLVGDRFEIRNRPLLGVEIRDVKRVTGFGEILSSQELEADLLLAGRDAGAVHLPLSIQLPLDAFEVGLGSFLAVHQEDAPAPRRMVGVHEDAPVHEARVRPGMIGRIGDRDLFARLAAHFPLHHDETACGRVLRFQIGVFWPSRVHVGLKSVCVPSLNW